MHLYVYLQIWQCPSTKPESCFCSLIFVKHFCTSCYSFITSESDIQASQVFFFHFSFLQKAISSWSQSLDQIHETNGTNRYHLSLQASEILGETRAGLCLSQGLSCKPAPPGHISPLLTVSARLILSSVHFPSAVHYISSPLHQITYMMLMLALIEQLFNTSNMQGLSSEFSSSSSSRLNLGSCITQRTEGKR